MGRVSTEVKQRALELLRNGHSKASAAEMTGVKYVTIDKWANELQAQTAVPVTTGHVEPIGPALVSSGKVQPLAEQLGGMNTEGPTLIGATEPQLSTIQPQSTPNAPVQPELAPEALIALVKLTKAGFVQMVAAGYQISLDHKDLDRLSSFTPLEEEQLKVLAPFAASYAGQFEQYTRPVMACLFFGCVGISSMRSFKELKTLRPPKPQKAVIKSGPKVDK